MIDLWTITMLCIVSIFTVLMWIDMRVFRIVVNLIPQPLAGKIADLIGYCNAHPKGRKVIIAGFTLVALISSFYTFKLGF